MSYPSLDRLGCMDDAKHEKQEAQFVLVCPVRRPLVGTPGGGGRISSVEVVVTDCCNEEGG